jgi:methionine-R-sulfoxide reductase
VKDEDFKDKLTSQQYSVMRQKATEAPYSGALLKNKQSGEYKCAACGNELFTDEHKFELPEHDPNAGWPSFSGVTDNKNIKLIEDNSYGMHRTEVTCAKCGSHLGHLFDDGPSETKEHYCINSCALDFKPTENTK